MSVIETIVLEEEPMEVILFLTKNEQGISLPRLDRLYNMAGWAHVGDIMGLLNILRKMHDAGLVILSGVGVARGPNWREPTFMLEGKYTFD